MPKVYGRSHKGIYRKRFPYEERERRRRMQHDLDLAVDVPPGTPGTPTPGRARYSRRRRMIIHNVALKVAL